MITPKEAFELHREDITSITEDSKVRMNRPIEKINGEVSQLVVVAHEDRPHFESITRFKLSNIDTLETRLAAFLYCYSEYNEMVFGKSDSLKTWINLEPRATKVRRRVLSRMSVIAREKGDQETLKFISALKRGKSRDDLATDFTKIINIIDEWSKELFTFGYTEEDIAEIHEIEAQLRSLLGKINLPQKDLMQLKELMEQSYTYLTRAETAIKDYGQILFENTDRETLYISKLFAEYGSRPDREKAL